MFDYIDLRLAMIRKCGSVKAFCEENGLDTSSIIHMLKTGAPMSHGRMTKLAELLNIEEQDMGSYFFRKKVLNSNTEAQ